MPLPLLTDPAVRAALDDTLDPDFCYLVIRSRDPRFDGRFFTAVRSTGIYCRPSCPARTPARTNVSFTRTAATAQRAGYRACKRCLPDAAPGSPAWDLGADVAARAVRLVEDGVVDREGVEGLAARLGYSTRHLRRHLRSQVGVGPLTLARARRARTARLLLENTDLTAADVAFSAGFGSVRQCNETLRALYDAPPSTLRARAGRHSPGARITGRTAGSTAGPATGYDDIELRLPVREPADTAATLRFLGAHAVAGVEDYDGTTYRRTLRLPHGPGLVAVRPGPGDAHGSVAATVSLADARDLSAAVARLRRLLDLDADPHAVAEHLSADRFLAPLVARYPGRRVVGTADPAESLLRLVLGQQVSLDAARRLTGQVVEIAGTALPHGRPGPTRLFPEPAALAAVDPTTLPVPAARGRAVVALAGALADGLRLDGSGAELEAALLAIPGVGPWTARCGRMRLHPDSDVLLADDLVVRRAAADLGLPADRRALAVYGSRWAPWRSYATALLWAHGLDTPTRRPRPPRKETP